MLSQNKCSFLDKVTIYMSSYRRGKKKHALGEVPALDVCVKGEIFIISFTFIIQKWAPFEMAPTPAG